MKVNITNVEYLATGQFDVVYNSSLLNVWTPPTSGTINDTLCGNIPVDITYEGIGGNWNDSGQLRILVEVPWAWETGENCSGGEGTGPCGDGYLTILTFRGMNPGSGEIAFYPTLQMNQIVDWTIYEDYSYDDSILVWGANASVTVNAVITPTPTASPSPSPSPTATMTPICVQELYGDANGDVGIDAFDLGLIRNMILQKSPVYPGGDANAGGVIDAFDLGVVRNIILVKTTAKVMDLCLYNFSCGAGSNRWAEWNNITAPPPALSETFDTDPTGWTEATSGQYTNIATVEGTMWNISGSSGNYTALQCKFTVAEGADAGNVSSIGVTFNGSSQGSGDLLQFWVWNFTNGEWTQVGSNISLQSSGNPGYISWTMWGKVYADYIDASNYMYILYNHNTASKYLNVDYVKLELASPQ